MPFDKFFTFLLFSYMRKALSVLFLISFMSVSTVLAADTPEDTNSNSGTIAPVLSTSQTGTTAVSGTLSPRETSVSPQSPSPIEFNAATTTPPPVSAPSAGSSLGEYKSVACTTNPAFTTNSCNQCFIG